MKGKKRGQIWVETVTYTLIALVMIATVLAVVRPKIQEIQDKATIERTIEIMEFINSEIDEAVRGGAGNVRAPLFGLKKGEMVVNPTEIVSPTSGNIIYTLKDSKSAYTEPGVDVKFGNVIIRTEKVGKFHIVTITLDYKEKYILQTPGNSELNIPKASTPYKLKVSNLGQKVATVTVTACTPVTPPIPDPCIASAPDGLDYTVEYCDVNTSPPPPNNVCYHQDIRPQLNFKLA